MDLLFSKYESLLRKTLGDDVVAAYSMGSAAIPGMVGSPMIDILLCLKNAPPTGAQVRGICKSNGTENIYKDVKLNCINFKCQSRGGDGNPKRC